MPPPRSGPGFSYIAGVHVVGTSIWCDAARPRGVCFLSRGDVALGRARPDRVITSERSAALRRALGLACEEPLLPRIGRPFALGRTRLELLPSGRLPGAAQLLVELGAWRGLYAGAVCPRALPGVAPAQVRACDELVLEAPEVGGIVDGMAALDAAVAKAIAESGAPPRIEVEDPAVLLALADRYGRDALALSGRWRGLGRWLPARSAKRRGERGLRVESGAAGRRRRSTTEHVLDPHVVRVHAGQRAPGVRALGLGLLPTVDELAQFVADTGARRVFVRVGSALEQAGAQHLVARLRAAGLHATPMGRAEQLRLL